jgi:hypothetical protein
MNGSLPLIGEGVVPHQIRGGGPSLVKGGWPPTCEGRLASPHSRHPCFLIFNFRFYFASFSYNLFILFFIFRIDFHVEHTIGA